MDKQRAQKVKDALESLAQHPGFHVLLEEMDKFSKMMYNIADLDLYTKKQLPFEVECAARLLAGRKVEVFMKNLRLLSIEKTTDTSSGFE